MLHLNNKYVRHGELDIKQLFAEDDVTDEVLQKKTEVEMYVKGMLSYQTMQDEPEIPLHSSCSECPFYGYCGKDVPPYSIFDLLRADKANAFFNSTHSCDIKDLPLEYCTTDKQLIDRDCFLTDKIHVEPEKIKEWLDSLEYPPPNLIFVVAMPCLAVIYCYANTLHQIYASP